MLLKMTKTALSGCALAALIAMASNTACGSSVSFVGSSGPSQSLSFTVVNGRLQVALTTSSATPTPSAALQNVSWNMSNTPVLAVNQSVAGPSGTTFPLAQAASTVYTFAAAVAPTDLWKQFASYTPGKGVAGPGSTLGGTTNTLRASPAAASAAFGGTATTSLPVKVALTLASTYDFISNGVMQEKITGAGASENVPLGPAAVVPIPPAFWTGLPMLVGMLVFRRVRAGRKSV